MKTTSPRATVVAEKIVPNGLFDEWSAVIGMEPRTERDRRKTRAVNLEAERDFDGSGRHYRSAGQENARRDLDSQSK
jgi:hypothetical protein